MIKITMTKIMMMVMTMTMMKIGEKTATKFTALMRFPIMKLSLID